jgi:hypothetical protein
VQANNAILVVLTQIKPIYVIATVPEADLIVSQVLTLFTVPVTFLYMERFSEWLAAEYGRRRGRRRSAETGAQPAA